MTTQHLNLVSEGFAFGLAFFAYCIGASLGLFVGYEIGKWRHR